MVGAASTMVSGSKLRTYVVTALGNLDQLIWNEKTSSLFLSYKNLFQSPSIPLYEASISICTRGMSWGGKSISGAAQGYQDGQLPPSLSLKLLPLARWGSDTGQAQLPLTKGRTDFWWLCGRKMGDKYPKFTSVHHPFHGLDPTGQLPGTQNKRGVAQRGVKRSKVKPPSAIHSHWLSATLGHSPKEGQHYFLFKDKFSTDPALLALVDQWIQRTIYS